jgi:two-component system nitrate/nitrite response regulator NarL
MTDLISSIRILIADGDTLFCEMLHGLLEQESEFRVVGVAKNGLEVFDRVQKLKPDVLLLDLAMPRSSGLEVLHSLFNKKLDLRTLLMAVEIHSSQWAEAMILGARGVVLKDTSTELLFKSIRAVMAGEYWVGNNGISHLVDRLRTPPRARQHANGTNGHGLSQRELQIVAAVADGLENKDIAEKLALSAHTIKHHLTNIFVKTGISNRLKLGLWARQYVPLNGSTVSLEDLDRAPAAVNLPHLK